MSAKEEKVELEREVAESRTGAHSGRVQHAAGVWSARGGLQLDRAVGTAPGRQRDLAQTLRTIAGGRILGAARRRGRGRSSA